MNNLQLAFLEALESGTYKQGYSLRPDCAATTSETDLAVHVAGLSGYLAYLYQLDSREPPGVLHYEVTPELGVWVAQNPDATPADFLREAVKQLNAFYAKEQP